MPRPRTGADLNCEHCGRSYYVKRHKLSTARFCSVECRRAHYPSETRRCAECGKEFLCRYTRVASGEGKFCSKSCQNAAQRTAVERACAVCGSLFSVWLSKASRGLGIYCSKPCQAKGTSLRVEASCETCGRPFMVQRDRVARGIGRFCSNACKAAALRNRVSVNCVHCGSAFETTPGRLQDGRGRYCSRDCYYDYVGTGESGVEAVVRQALASAGVAFQQEAQVGRYRIDFLIGRLALEIDGNFWHSLPGAQQKDRRKDQYLAAHGYRVLRVGEDLARSDPQHIVLLVEGRVQSNGTVGD